MRLKVELTAPSYVPFEPRTPEQFAVRDQLRRRVSALRPGPEEMLYASLTGKLPHGADVENALFYNIQAAGVFEAMRRGVSFEMTLDPLPVGVRYRYDTGSVERGFRCWRGGRRLARLDVRLGESPPKLASIWWALRSTDGSIRASSEHRSEGEQFVLALNVEGPTSGLTPALLKVILDGTICALQSEADSTMASSVASRVARAVGASTDVTLRALLDDVPSALGSRTPLVHTHGQGLKWEPDDHLCVAARVLFTRADQWRIAGTVDTAALLAPGGQ
jgi:hypothetical protein